MAAIPTRTITGTKPPEFGWVFRTPMNPPPFCSWCGETLRDVKVAPYGKPTYSIVCCPTCDGWGAWPNG